MNRTRCVTCAISRQPIHGTGSRNKGRRTIRERNAIRFRSTQPRNCLSPTPWVSDSQVSSRPDAQRQRDNGPEQNGSGSRQSMTSWKRTVIKHHKASDKPRDLETGYAFWLSFGDYRIYGGTSLRARRSALRSSSTAPKNQDGSVPLSRSATSSSGLKRPATLSTGNA